MGDGRGGALAGAWAWREAVAGAVIIVAANGLLYPLAARMDRLHSEVGREVQAADYILEVECERNAAQAVRSMIIDALTGPTLQIKALGWRNAGTPEQVVLCADVSAAKRDDSHLENAVRAVSGEPAVRVARWSAKNEAAADWVSRASARPPATGNPSADTHTVPPHARDRDLSVVRYPLSRPAVGPHRAGQHSD